MYLSYRGIMLPAGEVSVAISRPLLVNQMGNSYGFTEKWQITGQRLATDSSDVTTQLRALEAVFSVDGGDLILYQSDGVTPTAHAMYNSQSASGTRIVSRPVYPKGDGSEYVYFRSYVVEIEAEFHVNTNENQYSEFSEKVSFGGGGPKNIWVPILNGTPQPEQVYPATTFRASQSGRAVGLFGLPRIPSPLWPDFLVEPGEYTYGSPRKVPGPNRSYRDYEVEWSYKYESDGPLNGFPSFPP